MEFYPQNIYYYYSLFLTIKWFWSSFSKFFLFYFQGGGGASGEQQKAAQERQEQIKDMKNSILSQVLDQSARARLNTIMLCKPEKAQQIENMICQMAQTGQIMNKLGENELIGLLEQISNREEKKSSVKVSEVVFAPKCHVFFTTI